MPIKYSKQYLHKLEDLMSETAYILRYEKGNFKSGYCIINTNKVVVINKYFTNRGKIDCLIEIFKAILINTEEFSKKNKMLLSELYQSNIES